MEILERSEDLFLRAISCVAKGAAMTVSKWPEAAPSKNTRNENVKTRTGPDIDSIGDHEDAHVIRTDGAGRFECAVCRRVAYTKAGARRMSQSTCGGLISDAIHQSHHICRSQGLSWCRRCVAFSPRWPRQLLYVCPPSTTVAGAEERAQTSHTGYAADHRRVLGRCRAFERAAKGHH